MVMVYAYNVRLTAAYNCRIIILNKESWRGTVLPAVKRGLWYFMLLPTVNIWAAYRACHDKEFFVRFISILSYIIL